MEISLDSTGRRGRTRGGRRTAKRNSVALRNDKKPLDARVRRTRNSLRDALIILSLEMDYTSITIRDITTEADVGYATFFRHYRDKDQLLHDVLDSALEGMFDYIQPALEAEDFAPLGRLLFEYIADDPELYVVLLRNRFRLQLLERAVSECFNMYEIIGITLDRENRSLKMVFHHMGASIIALIEWWLSTNLEQDASEIGAFFHEVVAKPVEQYLKVELGKDDA